MPKPFNFLTSILQAFSHNLKSKAYKARLKIKDSATIAINNIKTTLLSFKSILTNIVNKSISFIISNNWFILTSIHSATP